MLAEMFSHDPEAEEFTKTSEKIGFFGNDGVCRFKYFIRDEDPQKAFVWTILLIYLICFMVVAACYIIVGIISTKSSRKASHRGRNQQIRQRNRRMNRNISIIITTDFISWMPFIVICVSMLHYLEAVDASP